MSTIITKFQKILYKQHLQIKSKLTNLFPYTFCVYEETTKPSLGRWQSHECTEKTFSKVDYSNVDHCGPCGLTHMDKQPTNDSKHTTL